MRCTRARRRKAWRGCVAISVQELDGLDDARACARRSSFRVDALRVQVHRERDEVHVAGALAIAEQCGPRPGDRHPQSHAEFGRGHTATAIVVRVQAGRGSADDAPCARTCARSCLRTRSGVLISTGGRKIDHHGLAVLRLPDLICTASTTSIAKSELGAREALRRVLELPGRLGLRRQRTPPPTWRPPRRSH